MDDQIKLPIFQTINFFMMQNEYDGNSIIQHSPEYRMDWNKMDGYFIPTGVSFEIL